MRMHHRQQPAGGWWLFGAAGVVKSMTMEKADG